MERAVELEGYQSKEMKNVRTKEFEEIELHMRWLLSISGKQI